MATVRAITSAASVNIGAISYHFGSRDNLMIAICSRHMEVANEDILDDLTRLKQQSGEVFVEDIFRPLINTAFEVWMHDHVLRGLRAFLFLDNELNKKFPSNISYIGYNEFKKRCMRYCKKLALGWNMTPYADVLDSQWVLLCMLYIGWMVTRHRL